MRWRTPAIALLAMALTGAGYVYLPSVGWSDSETDARLRVSEYLAALVRDTGDRGWDLLEASGRAHYGSEEAYRGAMAEADWTDFEWEFGDSSRCDDGVCTFIVRLPNGIYSAPTWPGVTGRATWACWWRQRTRRAAHVRQGWRRSTSSSAVGLAVSAWSCSGPKGASSGRRVHLSRNGTLRVDGEIDEHHPIVGAQSYRNALADPGCVDRRVAADLAVDPHRLIEEAGVLREPIGPLAHLFQAPLDTSGAQVADALQLVVGRAVGCQTVDFGEERVLQGLVCDPGPCRDLDRQDRRSANEREGEAGDILSKLLLADVGPIQT
jgi:hypothetical protein